MLTQGEFKEMNIPESKEKTNKRIKLEGKQEQRTSTEC